MFVPLPYAMHVGKILKSSLANWNPLLQGTQSSLAVMSTYRGTDPSMRKLLPRERVVHKDGMDYRCILQLTDDHVLDKLETCKVITHTILSDRYKVSDIIRVGLYPTQHTYFVEKVEATRPISQMSDRQEASAGSTSTCIC